MSASLYHTQPIANAAHELRCICGHHVGTHIFDPARLESICAASDCSCVNYHRWEVKLLDPSGIEYLIHDVQKFCRVDFRGAFRPEDLIEKPRPSSSKTWTNAESGLQKLAEDAIPSWKGWTLITKPKTFRA